MKSPEEIHSMIEFLQARGMHSDSAVLKWVTGADKSEWETKHDAAVRAAATAAQAHAQAMAELQKANVELQKKVGELTKIILSGGGAVRT